MSLCDISLSSLGLVVVMACLVSSGASADPLEAEGLETLVYRGQLSIEEAPAQGRFDFRFHLYETSDPASERPVETVERFGIELLEGRLEVELDFALLPEVEQGALGIEVSPANAGDFRTLHPTQSLDRHRQVQPAQSKSSIGSGGSYVLESVSSGDLRASGKVAASGFELNGDLVTSWNDVGQPLNLQHRGPMPEMSLAAGGGWVTGGGKSAVADGPGRILMLLTGTARQAFPSGDYWAHVEIGLGTTPQGVPTTPTTAINLGQGNNSYAAFVLQHVESVSQPGIYTYYTMARHRGGFSPTLIKPEALTLLFFPD